MAGALVTGGTGHIGRALVKHLSAQGVPTAFSYCTQQEQASSLASETGAHAIACDLLVEGASSLLLAKATEALGAVPTILIDAVTPRVDVHALSSVQCDVHYRVRVEATMQLLDAWQAAGPESGEAILLSSMPGAVDVAGPLWWSMSNAARWGLVRGYKRPFGVDGLRINLVVLGVTDGGISADLSPEARAAYLKYAAYRKAQTAAEIAQFITAWCATNTYATGTRIVASGGL